MTSIYADPRPRGESRPDGLCSSKSPSLVYQPEQHIYQLLFVYHHLQSSHYETLPRSVITKKVQRITTVRPILFLSLCGLMVRLCVVNPGGSLQQVRVERLKGRFSTIHDFLCLSKEAGDSQGFGFIGVVTLFEMIMLVSA